MEIHQAIAIVAILSFSALATGSEPIQSQFGAGEAPYTIGTEGVLKLKKSQVRDLAMGKGLTPGSTSAKQLTNQYTGQGVELGSLKEKELLDLWRVLSPQQRDDLSGHFNTSPPATPDILPGSTIPFRKVMPWVLNIPPDENTPPSSLIRNGSPILIEQIKNNEAREAEADACEVASAKAREWANQYDVESSLIPCYEQSLNDWVGACLTQDFGDNASLAGLDAAIVKQVVGILSYGQTSFCTGFLKDGKVITARHCFVKNEDAYMPADWVCPKLPGADDLWCTTNSARETLQFRRGSDPEAPIPISLSEAGITEPTGYEFRTDQIALAVRSDNPVSLTGLPSVEWDEPKINELVWLAGPVVSATDTDKYQGLYWSKFLAGKCRVVELEGLCVRHYCQTVTGFSGSPLVSKTMIVGGQSVVKVVGIHLGGSESYEECKSNTIRLNIAQKVIQ